MVTHPDCRFTRRSPSDRGACICLTVLMGFATAAQAAPGTHVGPAKGPLRIHPENPRYFTDGTKGTDGSLRVVYLVGAHTWNNLVDMGRSDPPEGFDFPAYLNFLRRHNHNFIRLWAWDSATWDTQANGSLGKDFIHRAAPLPWARTGPGNALDGKPRFDLTQFEPAYFDRLRLRVAAAGERGIYASVMLFEGWGLMHGNRRANTQDGWAWRSHPFNPANNINKLTIEGADAFSGQVHTLRNPEANRLQAAYVRKVVDTVNHLDNVLYEVINEGGDKEWNWWVIKTVQEYERTKLRQHPVGDTGHGAERLASLLASPADWVSPGRVDGFAENPPAWNEKKVSLLDTDHIWGVGGNAAWVWRSFLRGHNPIFMDPYDGSVLGQDRGWESLRAALGQTRRLAQRMNLAAMVPRNDLASTAYCLASPGGEYLVYLPDGKAVTVDLRTAAASFSVEWINPRSGDTERGESVSGGAKRSLKPPFEGDAVLFLRRQQSASSRLNGPGPLIEAAELAARLRDEAVGHMVLLDVRELAPYEQEHVAGAIRVDPAMWKDESLAAESGLDHEELWRGRIGSLGVSGCDPVVIYDDGRMTEAARVWFIFQHFDVPNTAVLNGGYPALKLLISEGRISIGCGTVTATPVQLVRGVGSHSRIALVDRHHVRQAAERRQVQIFDARTREEYSGVDLRKNTRGGHIPSAINLPHKELLDEKGRLKSREALAAMFQQAGFKRGQPIITHCDGGGRASLAALAAERAGYGPVMNYYLSFGDWAADATCPLAGADK